MDNQPAPTRNLLPDPQAGWILLLGDINTDIILHVQEYPAVGGDSLVDQATITPGGSVSNAACVLARLGLHPRLIAQVGGDAFGDAALRLFQQVGVDISLVERDPDLPTGLIFVPTVPGGERTMFSYRGANAGLSPSLINLETFANAGYLHLSGYDFLASPQREAAWKAVEIAGSQGVPVSLDINPAAVQQARSDLLRVIGRLDACILGVGDGQELTHQGSPEDIACSLLGQGVKLAAVKLGVEGALLADQYTRTRIHPFRVASIDSTGAGDAFSAGIIFGRVMKWEVAPTGVLAAALGALATAVSGAGSNLPGREAVLGLLHCALERDFPDGENDPIQQVITALE